MARLDREVAPTCSTLTFDPRSDWIRDLIGVIEGALRLINCWMSGQSKQVSGDNKGRSGDHGLMPQVAGKASLMSIVIRKLRTCLDFYDLGPWAGSSTRGQPFCRKQQNQT